FSKQIETGLRRWTTIRRCPQGPASARPAASLCGGWRRPCEPPSGRRADGGEALPHAVTPHARLS
ncbi:hypothetical protein M885DRAFT_545195, partial [Pelagophyceae sp. CCMP2097]